MLTMAERLLWEASYPAGAESAGLDIGERVNDQLKDYIMLDDLLNQLQCICDALGASNNLSNVQDLVDATEGELPLSWDDYTHPGLGEGVPKLYGKANWTEALETKCQLAQHFVDALIDNLDWLDENWQINLQALDWVNRVIDRMLGRWSPWAGHLWEWITVVQRITYNWAAQAKSDIEGLRNALITIIYEAEQPNVAAVQIGNAVPALAITRPVLELLLRYGVWEGQYPGAVSPIDASTYSPTFCSTGTPLGTNQYLYFDPCTAWTSSGRTSNWTCATRNSDDTYFNVSGGESIFVAGSVESPTINMARSSTSGVDGLYGTNSSIVVPGGASQVSMATIARPYPYTNRNIPRIKVDGSVSGAVIPLTSSGSGAVTPGETLTVRLESKNFATGSSATMFVYRIRYRFT